MFFPKLRRKAKWVFLALAVMFALSVVFFGVGTGITGANPIDAILGVFEERRAAGGGPSVEDAREKVAEDPKNGEARLELANALQAADRTEEAITHLEAYVAQRPRDATALQQLAALYDSQARTAQERAVEAQTTVQGLLFPQTFAPAGPVTQALGPPPVSEALSARANARASAAFQEMQQAYAREAEVYERLTKLLPDDPAMFLQLGQASQFAGDTDGAIAAYRRFLALAPDDPNAAIVREQIRQLRQGAGSG